MGIRCGERFVFAVYVAFLFDVLEVGVADVGDVDVHVADVDVGLFLVFGFDVPVALLVAFVEEVAGKHKHSRVNVSAQPELDAGFRTGAQRVWGVVRTCAKLVKRSVKQAAIVGVRQKALNSAFQLCVAGALSGQGHAPLRQFDAHGEFQQRRLTRNLFERFCKINRHISF